MSFTDFSLRRLDWHSEFKTNDWDCDQLIDFYAELESKLYELTRDMIKSRAKDSDSGLFSSVVGHTVPLFSWQYACPICFSTGDEEILDEMARRGDSCGVYLLQLSRISRHLNARTHWTENSDVLLQAELARLSPWLLKVTTAVSTTLRELDLYEWLPKCSQTNLTFRPDEINHEMYLDERWEMDCLGRTGMHQSLDALSDRNQGIPAQIYIALSPVDVDTQDVLGRTLLYVTPGHKVRHNAETT